MGGSSFLELVPRLGGCYKHFTAQPSEANHFGAGVARLVFFPARRLVFWVVLKGNQEERATILGSLGLPLKFKVQGFLYSCPFASYIYIYIYIYHYWVWGQNHTTRNWTAGFSPWTHLGFQFLVQIFSPRPVGTELFGGFEGQPSETNHLGGSLQKEMEGTLWRPAFFHILFFVVQTYFFNSKHLWPPQRISRKFRTKRLGVVDSRKKCRLPGGGGGKTRNQFPKFVPLKINLIILLRPEH